MINFKFSNGLKHYNAMLRDLTDSQVRRVIASSINKSGMKLRTVAKRTITKNMGISQKTLKDDPKNFGSIKLISASSKSGSDFSARLINTGDPVRLILYSASQRHRKVKGAYRGAGVTAKAWGVKKLYKSAFIANIKYAGGGETSGVFTRKSDDSLPIKQLYGAGLARESERAEDPLWKYYISQTEIIVPRVIDDMLKRYPAK